MEETYDKLSPAGPGPSPVPASHRSERRTRPLWLWALLAVLSLAMVFPAVHYDLLRPKQAPALPVLWQIPEWKLLDQNGRPFGSEQLRGRVYIANFVFTTCVMSCPRLSSRMADLQAHLKGMNVPVRLVSVSVDPVNDTPERLLEYGSRFKQNPAVWTFVTGPEDAVTRAVDQGFRVGVERPARGPNGEFNPIALAHSNRFALVDGRGRLRGSYDADDEGMAKILSDAARLAAGH